MDTKQIALSIIGLALTGVTVLAFKMPKVYKHLWDEFRWVFVLGFLGVQIWYAASEATWWALRELIPDAALDKAKLAKEGVQPVMGWFYGGFIGAYLYLKFLEYLGDLVNHYKAKEAPKEPVAPVIQATSEGKPALESKEDKD